MLGGGGAQYKEKHTYLPEKHQDLHYSFEGTALAWLKNALGPDKHIN